MYPFPLRISQHLRSSVCYPRKERKPRAKLHPSLQLAQQQMATGGELALGPWGREAALKGKSDFQQTTLQKALRPCAPCSTMPFTVESNGWSPEQRHKVGEGGQDTRDSHPGHGQPRVSQGTSLLRRRSNDNPQPSSICPRESTGGGVLKHTHLQTTKCSLNIRHHHFTLKSASSIVSLSGLLARILVIACLASLQALGAALRLWHN